VTCNKPTGVVQNDIMVAIYGYGNASAPTAPTDWNLLGTTVANTQIRYSFYYKIAGGSEPADYTWTNGSDKSRVVIGAWTGDYDVLDPIDVVSNTAYITNDSTVRAASMSVTN